MIGGERPLLREIFGQQSSTFGENYSAPCSAVSAIAEHLVKSRRSRIGQRRQQHV